MSEFVPARALLLATKEAFKDEGLHALVLSRDGHLVITHARPWTGKSTFAATLADEDYDRPIREVLAEFTAAADEYFSSSVPPLAVLDSSSP